MDTSDIMRAMAVRLNQIPELTGRAHYPKPKNLPPSPCVVITEGGATSPPSPIGRSTMDGQEWRPYITVHVLVSYEGESQEEESRIDPLIAPIIDAFDPVAWDGAVGDVLLGLTGHIDAMDPISISRGTTTYAGTPCYVAMIVFQARFSRQPELIPLEIVP